MRRKLLARHRVLRLGVGLVGASALAVGFATPALATVSSGGNSASANYQILEGGSATTYDIMSQLAFLFNEAPGCDLQALSGTAQTLDEGCPGINGEPGQTLSAPQIVTQTGSTVGGGTSVTVPSTAGFYNGNAVTDTAGDIPNNDTVASVTNSTTFVLSKAATGTDGSDSISVTTSPAVGENGFTNWGNENPFNDVLVEEPPNGSSTGIQQLEDQNTHAAGATSDGSAVNVAPLDVASSARAPALTGTKAGDDKGLNFVAYAMDAIDWLHWTSVKGVATPSASVTSLTVAQLTSIYQDAGCTTPGGTSYTTPNWACYGGTAGPIAIYIPQSGAGVESTWATLLGLTSGHFPYGNEDPGHVIFQNETASILANGDEADAIVPFSYGNYETTCTANPSHCSGASNSTLKFGEINSVKVKSKSITAQLPGHSGTPFPGDTYLYNVYSDGSNADILASSPAALNAVSEDGFLCKPSTATDIDPNTGSTYRSEINAEITAAGFVPLPLEVENGQGVTSNSEYDTTASAIPHPAWSDGLSASNYNANNETFPAANQDTDNSAVNGGPYTGVYDGGTTKTVTPSASNPVGYCLVETTDGNSTN